MIYSLVDDDRKRVIRELLNEVKPLKGVLVEVGVYRGGTAEVIASTLPGRVLYAFDTFTGIPHHDPAIDHHQIGDFSDTSLEEVESNLAHLKNIWFCPGIFPEETGYCLDGSSVCFVHLDVDVYESNKRALEFLYPKLVPNAVVVFDDWEWAHCPGIKKSVLEFLQDKPEQIVKSVAQQAYFRKANG